MALHLVLIFTLISVGSGSISSSHHPYSRYSKEPSENLECKQAATCKPLHNATCFGTVLPYSYTSLTLVGDSSSQFEIQDNLNLWQGLRSVPRCWAVIQPLLCAVYMPKCENGSVFLPSQEMCRITRGPCKAVEIKHAWPKFLQCSNKTAFPPRCKNPLQEIKFNVTSKCIRPLAESDNEDSWYDEVKGCGMQCQDPFFSKKDHEDTHYIIKIFGGGSFCATLFAVATYFISWKKTRNSPNFILFYINLCLAIASFGWLIQFFPGAREEIVCLHDGTIRLHQPRSGEHLCTITFFLVYFFLIAAIVWFVILTYTWRINFRERSSFVNKTKMKKKAAYFQICAWCIPLVLTTTTMALKEVDGDSMSGICFVGYSNMNMRIFFLLLPVGIAALIGGFFLCSVIYTLIRLKYGTGEFANARSRKKINRITFKTGLVTALAIIFIVSTFACHAYEFLYRKEWTDSLREYIVCLAMNSAQSYSNMEEMGVTKCAIKSKPSVMLIRLHMMCFFGFALVMASWVWTSNTVEAWKNFFYSRCAPEGRREVILKKHELIAKAFSRRHELNQGQYNMSLSHTHEDPAGMNLDASSIASRDISSSWAMALPNLLMRRNAVTSIPHFNPRRCSSVSDISRHISVDSFNQADTPSLGVSEQDYNVRRIKSRKTRKELERLLRASHVVPRNSSRRGSDTSLQSSLMAASMVAVAAKNVSRMVTKSTSTRDLSQASVQTTNPTVLPPAPAFFQRSLTRSSVGAFRPSFTHSMGDNNPCRMVCKTNQVQADGSGSAESFTPNHMQVSNLPTQMMDMLTPLYSQQGFNFPVNPFQAYGYMGGSAPTMPHMDMFYGPNFPAGIPFGYPFHPMQYAQYAPTYPNSPNGQIPMHPRAESASASEAEYLPVSMSESELDQSLKSCDEELLLTAHLVLQQQQQQWAQQARAQQMAPKPTLEPQECAKTKFLQMMSSFKAKAAAKDSSTQCANEDKGPTTGSPSTRKKSSRKDTIVEGPHPSPEDSSNSLDEIVTQGDDDVFEEGAEVKVADGDLGCVGQNSLHLGQLHHSLQHLSRDPNNTTHLPKSPNKSRNSFVTSPTKQGGVLHRLRTKFRCASSLSRNISEPESVELNPKLRFGSVGHLPNREMLKTPCRIELREGTRHLGLPECQTLLNKGDINGNLSR